MEERALEHTAYLFAPSTGSLPPVLCIHGALCGAWYFADALPFMGALGHPSYAITLPGHDLASKEHIARITIDDMVSATRSVVDMIHRTHGVLPIVVGHSMGGAVAQLVAKHYESEHTPLSGLILMQSAPLDGLWKDVCFMHVWRTSPLGDICAGLWALFTKNPVVAQRPFLERLFSPYNSPHPRQDIFLKITPESSRALSEILFGFPTPRITNTPLALIEGSVDPVIPHRATLRLVQAYHIPSDNILTTKGGHMHLFEDGWKDTLSRALTRVTAGVAMNPS
jgi:pimeloyl-ACP methyl ester carboxylesterase